MRILGFVGALLTACALGGCGREGLQDFLLGPSTDVIERAPAPIPTPPPSASPTPMPLPSPTPDPRRPDSITDNQNPVAWVSLAVYFVECGGRHVEGSGGSTEAPVGCRLHMNATPRDGSGAPTSPLSWPVWRVSNMDLVSGGQEATFTATYSVSAPGLLTVWCSVDGVASNVVGVRLVR
jgi:hypothetical protein